MPYDIIDRILQFARRDIRSIACVNVQLSIICRASHFRSIIDWWKSRQMLRLWQYLYRYLSKVESGDLLLEWEQFFSLVDLVPEDDPLGFHVQSFSHVSSGLLDM